MKLLDGIKKIVRPKNLLQKKVLWWINELQRKHKLSSGDYFEFGCFRGASAINFHRALKASPSSFPKPHMYLFDSFTGLPEIAHKADEHVSWEKGTFDIGGDDMFREIMKKNNISSKDYSLVPGFFENSLPKFDWSKSQRASFVWMDCDYYSSTKCALDNMKPLLKSSSLIYFDDLHAFSGHPNKGQHLAINEFNEENKDLGLVPFPHLYEVSAGRVYMVWES